jgi:hypothetical protein
MKSDTIEPVECHWTAALGAFVVVVLLTLLALSAMGGWEWVAEFLKSGAPAWLQAIGALVALYVAIRLARWQLRTQADLQAQERRREDEARHRANLETVAMDVRIAERQAAAYLSAGVDLPAYRLPLHGLQLAMPALLASGKLTGAQSTALAQFYVDAASFNLCLDTAQRPYEAEGGFRPRRGASRAPVGGNCARELRRLRRKAAHLVQMSEQPQDVEGDYSRFDEAIEALLRAGLPPASLSRLPHRVEFDRY